MPHLQEAWATIQANSISWGQYLKFLGIMVFGFLLISTLFRFLFSKKAQVNRAVSSAVEIFGVYVISIVIYSLGLSWNPFLSPLPFVSMQEDILIILPIVGTDFTVLCGQILRILIIAFLVNILNDIVPKGERVISWYLFRFLTVVLAVGVNYLADLLFTNVLPENIMQIAPAILMVSLVVLVLLGSLKLLVGVALSFLDPIVGALYTFFFSNIIGRELARAMVTTALLTALVYVLNLLEMTMIPIAAAALTAYIPLLAIVLVLWYIVGHIL